MKRNTLILNKLSEFINDKTTLERYRKWKRQVRLYFVGVYYIIIWPLMIYLSITITPALFEKYIPLIGSAINSVYSEDPFNPSQELDRIIDLNNRIVSLVENDSLDLAYSLTKEIKSRTLNWRANVVKKVGPLPSNNGTRPSTYTTSELSDRFFALINSENYNRWSSFKTNAENIAFLKKVDKNAILLIAIDSTEINSRLGIITPPKSQTADSVYQSNDVQLNADINSAHIQLLYAKSKIRSRKYEEAAAVLDTLFQDQLNRYYKYPNWLDLNVTRLYLSSLYAPYYETSEESDNYLFLLAFSQPRSRLSELDSVTNVNTPYRSIKLLWAARENLNK